MRLLFRQRYFSWFDSYDIYDETGKTRFIVKGELAWGHKLRIYNECNTPIALLRQEIFTIGPRFEIYINDILKGEIYRKFSFFIPEYVISFNGWHITGNVMQWDYQIINSRNELVATISKELFHMTDTYVLNIREERNTLMVLMTVLAIDAAKCHSNSANRH